MQGGIFLTIVLLLLGAWIVMRLTKWVFSGIFGDKDDGAARRAQEERQEENRRREEAERRRRESHDMESRLWDEYRREQDAQHWN